MMIQNVSLNAAINASAQSLSIGETNPPRQALVQSSSFTPIESLSSAGKAQIGSRDDFAVEGALSGDSQSLGAKGDTSQEPASNTSSDIQKEREATLEREREKQQLLKEQRQITVLSARDREVRAHEQAHAAVGGQYAGAPRYDFERGPDGVNYAVGGEVSIDTSKEPTPQETLRKAQIVRRAALAPAEPSPQDRRVAAQASQMESQARAEISQNRRAELNEPKESAESEEKEAPSGISDIEGAEAPAVSLESSPKPRFSPADVDSRQTISSFDDVSLATPTISSSQVLAFSDIEANRPGALLNQLV